MHKLIGKQRLYNVNFPGQNVVQWDVLDIKQEQQLILTFLSTNSSYRQGVRLAVDAGDGYIEINSIDYGKAVQLWFDTCPSELPIKCISSEGVLSVYNIFEDRCVNSQLDSCGMLIDSDSDTFTYRCNDEGFVSNFDKLVFSIKLVK